MLLIELLVMLSGGLFNLKEKCSETNILPLRYIFLLLYVSYLKANGSFIGYKSQFKSPPIFPHGINGIFISGDAKIGSENVIFQNVTIGSNTLPHSKGLGAPIVGDNCYIGTGAVIISGIKIGNNCRIGANATVVQDIPDNSLVVSPKSVVIKKEQLMNNAFFTKKNGKWGCFKDGSFSEERDTFVVEQLNDAFYK